MELYITEKPSVARGLVDYFNKNGASFKPMEDKKGYFDANQKIAISWCFGHLVYLEKPSTYDEKWKSWNRSTLPIIPEQFRFKKSVYKEASAQFNKLKALIKDSTTIIHCGDPDREGQVLVDEVLMLCKATAKVKRLLLNALDDKSISEALGSMTDNQKFKGLSLAGDARAYIDWLIGMNLTRLITSVGREKNFTEVIRIGRVKTPVLSMIINRELEIQNFVVKPIWSLRPTMNLGGDKPVQVSYPKKFDTKEEAEAIQKQIEHKPCELITLEEKRVEEKIKELYNMDTLQTEVNKRLGLTPKETAKILQSLYEKKLTTYPRSDCKYLPEGQLNDCYVILDHLAQANLFDVAIVPPEKGMIEKPIPFNDKKITAHHAIIPTTKPLTEISEQELAVYKIIAEKYASMFMDPFTYDKTTATFKVNDDITLTLNVKNVVKEGYKQLSSMSASVKEESDTDEKEVTGSFVLEKGKIYMADACYVNEGKTKPPKRYTAGSIIQAMTNITSPDKELAKKLKEVKGIGTPATRSDIVDQLIKENYVALQKKNLVPTQLAIDMFPMFPKEFQNAEYTALMELELDKVQSGELTQQQVLENVVTYIKSLLATSDTLNHNVKAQGFTCPVCKTGVLKRKHWKYDNGDEITYYRCDNEACKKQLPCDSKKNPMYIKCDQCGGNIIEKHGQYGFYYGCGNYPNCKHVIKAKDWNEYKKKNTVKDAFK